MQMPDRCYSDGTTHVTNISAVTTVPVHHMMNRVWPDGRDSAIGGAIILTGSSPLGLVASGLEALSYQLPRYIGGLLHTVRIFTHGTVPPGFRAEISVGGTGPTSFSGISTDLTYTPTSISVPYLHIYNLGMRDTIFIDSVHIDSATYEPYHVLSSISSSDGYAYGFNGQMKVNEWAGSGNHLDFGARGYESRTIRFNSIDPLLAKFPWYSPYQYAGNSPIVHIDKNGKEIWISHIEYNRDIPIVQAVQFKGGSLYNRDGSKYTGNNEYILGVYKDMLDIKNDHSLINYMVNNMEESSTKHYIQNSDPGYFNVEKLPKGLYNSARKGDEKPNASIIRYIRSNKSINNEIRHTRVGLAHEMKHGYDIQNNNRDFKTRTNNGITLDEVDATNVENLVRQKTGDEIRTWRGVGFDKKDISKEYLWDPNSSLKDLKAKLDKNQPVK